MQRTECLTEEELTAYQLGELSENLRAVVDCHLETCLRCNEAVERLDQLTDGVVDALRQFPPAAFVSAPDATCSVRRQPGKGSDARIRLTASEEPCLLPGYHIQGKLGQGGMGVVYKAHQLNLNRTVALKMVLAGRHATAPELARFLVEAEMVARLDHPNIVQIHQVGQHDGQPFIALEYIEGGTLADQMQGRRWLARPAAELLERLARAIHHAHQHGIVHRDLKPANILLTNAQAPKITDFGLAKLVQNGAGLTSTGVIIGTPTYMAPEQGDGNCRAVGPAADVYALGVILYELLAGQPPFTGKTPIDILQQVTGKEPAPLSRLYPDLPRDLCTICLRCLEKDPVRRYVSAEALADDLNRFLKGEPIQARPVGELERAWKWARRRPAIAGLAAAVAAVLLLGTGVSTYLALAERARAQEAVDARDKARRAEDKATEARDKAQQAETRAVLAKQASDEQAAELLFRAGLADAEAGLVDRGLVNMIEALRRTPDSATAFRQVIRTNLVSWSPRLPVVTQILPGQWQSGWFLGRDESTFVTANAENTLQRWDAATGLPVGNVLGPKLPGEVRCVTSDGKTGVTMENLREGPRFCLRDTATGDQLGIPLAGTYHSSSHVGVALGDKVVWVTNESWPLDRTVYDSQLFHIPTGEPIGPSFKGDFRLFRGRDGRTVLMTFPLVERIPTDEMLQAKFTDLDSGRSLAGCDPDVSGGDGMVRFDGRSIVTMGRDGLVCWWDPATGKSRRDPWRPGRTIPRGGGVALLGAGRTVVVRCPDNRLRYYDVATGREYGVSLVIPGSKPWSLPSSDGSAILVGSTATTVRLFHVNGLPALPGPAVEPDVPFLKVAYSPDRRSVVAGTGYVAQGPISLLTETATGLPLGKPMAATTYNPVFSSDGKLLAANTAHLPQMSPFVRIWDAASGDPLSSPLRTPTYIHGLAFAPDNHTLAIGCIGGTFLWDVRKSGTDRMLAQKAPVSRMLFSSDGALLATGSMHGWTGEQSCFRLWDLATDRPIGPAVPTSDAPLFFFSSDRRTLQTLELANGLLRRWDTATLNPVGSPISLQEGTRMEQALFRADGGRLLTGYNNGQVLQWDPDNGQRVSATMSHPASVTALAYSPTGQTLAVGCADGTARLWDAATGKPVGPPLVHRGAIQGLTFTNDGSSLLTTASDGVTRTWPVSAPPALEDLAVLENWLQAVSGLRGNGETVVLVPEDAWGKSREQLKKTWPEGESALARSSNPTAWRDRLVKEIASGGDDAAALWNLDRLIAREEVHARKDADRWLLHARRAKLHAMAGRFVAADADYARSVEGGEALLTWYRHRLAEAYLVGRWPVVLWYLDRLISARPLEWRLYANRWNVRTRLGKEAESDLDQILAVLLGGDVPFLLTLGDSHAARGRWWSAGVVYDVAELRSNTDLGIHQRQALVRLQLGCQAGYQAVGTRVAAILATDQLSLQTRLAAARLWFVGPDAVTDWSVPLEVTADLLGVLGELETANLPANEKAMLRHEVFQCRAGVLFRAGQHREALACLNRLVKEGAGVTTVDDWLLLALVQQRLGNVQEARSWLAKARPWLEAALRDMDWHKRLGVQLLHAEAERLLQEPAPK
jgi:eukaryotic-like serine/threonine-protein kinase